MTGATGVGEPTGLDIAYDELKDSYTRLRDQEARLNTEATFILGSASIVVGAVSGILGAVALKRGVARDLAHWGVGIDVALYFAVVYYASRAYTADAVQDFDPNDFTAYLDAPADQSKRELAFARLKLYQRSAYALQIKGRLTGFAAALFLAEVLCLAVLLIVVAASS